MGNGSWGAVRAMDRPRGGEWEGLAQHRLRAYKFNGMKIIRFRAEEMPAEREITKGCPGSLASRCCLIFCSRFLPPFPTFEHSSPQCGQEEEQVQGH